MRGGSRDWERGKGTRCTLLRALCSSCSSPYSSSSTGSSRRPHVQPSPRSAPSRPLPGRGHAAAFLCRRDGARPGRYEGGKRGLLLRFLTAGLRAVDPPGEGAEL